MTQNILKNHPPSSPAHLKSFQKQAGPCVQQERFSIVVDADPELALSSGSIFFWGGGGVGEKNEYTLRQTNIAGWKMDTLKMYFLLKMGIFQPASC